MFVNKANTIEEETGKTRSQIQNFYIKVFDYAAFLHIKIHREQPQLSYYVFGKRLNIYRGFREYN